MKYVVKFPGGWFLRGTVATGDRSRATRYATKDAAAASLEAARPYLKAPAYRAAQIVEVPE